MVLHNFAQTICFRRGKLMPLPPGTFPPAEMVVGDDFIDFIEKVSNAYLAVEF